MQSQTVEVWPEHWYAYQLFCAMRTQWVAATGFDRARWVGLRYEALSAVEQRLSPELRQTKPPVWKVFEQLRIMEYAVLRHLNSL